MKGYGPRCDVGVCTAHFVYIEVEDETFGVVALQVCRIYYGVASCSGATCVLIVQRLAKHRDCPVV